MKIILLGILTLISICITIGMVSSGSNLLAIGVMGFISGNIAGEFYSAIKD